VEWADNVRVKKARDKLIEHVVEVQKKIRTCEGCGLCCTAAYNSVAILPLEAHRIRAWIERLPFERRAELLRRIETTIRRFGLDGSGRDRNYTCAFLEKDFTCALPFEVKPIACLSFNPVHRERCEMEVVQFLRAHRLEEKDNEARGFSPKRLAIPVAVKLAVLERSTGKRRLTKREAKRTGAGSPQESGESLRSAAPASGTRGAVTFAGTSPRPIQPGLLDGATPATASADALTADPAGALKTTERRTKRQRKSNRLSKETR